MRTAKLFYSTITIIILIVKMLIKEVYVVHKSKDIDKIKLFIEKDYQFIKCYKSDSSAISIVFSIYKCSTSNI